MAQAGVMDDDKGRHADSPLQVPATGWKDILWRTYEEINGDRVTLIAAGITYYLLLALFPALTAFVSLYGLFADPATVGQHLGVLAGVVPEGGMAIIDEQLTRLTSSGGTKLGFALLVSLGLALWGTGSGVKTLFEAMNVAYDETEKRSFLALNATALLFTLAGIVGALVLIGAAVVVPVALDFLGLGSGLEWLLQIGAYGVLLVVLLAGVAALYRFGPSRRKAKWRWITPGAVLAIAVILVVSVLFSWYAANLGNFDATYGSLGGLIGMLTWMWLSVTALIVGAELNAETERQTGQDSTVGPDKPAGRRDAAAADTMGKLPGKTLAKPSSQGDAAEPADARSAEWQAGYGAAMRRFRPRPRPSLGALAFAIPASLALQALRKRNDGT